MSELTIQGGSGEYPSRPRPPFVGRATGLRQLESAFEAAAAGHGGLILLAGEPGIGKTALCEQLFRFVATHGGVPLVGHCYAEGSAGVPYQPFVEAFESYARGCDAETLSAQIGSTASVMARMVPAVRNVLQVELSAPESPDDDRLRLLSGVCDFLRSAGTTHPLLLVLEDLHDAERGTLDLLVYLARHLAGASVLVVGTYRDVEVDRAHPLAAALAELRRGSEVERIQVAELSVVEVQRLLATSSQQAVPRPLAEVVHRRAGGNALFAHELLRFLLAEGLLERRDGALRRVGDASLAGKMPEGLRDVVGKRLSRLSDAANQVLSVASVIGREFQLDVLRRLQPGTEDDLEGVLEEAVSAGLLEERAVIGAAITYRFSHAFFQQTLYDEILAPRRIRLHQQVARALEEVHVRRLSEHAAELAEHYAFSSDAGDLANAVHYGELAARRASEVFAYGEAVRHLERALAVQDLVDPDDRAKRCDLLLALGAALLPAGETEHVIMHTAPEALSVAERLGDRKRAFRACSLALDCFWAQGAGSSAAFPQYHSWAECASGFADPDSLERVQADLALAYARDAQGRWRESHALRLNALALARQYGDRETLFRSALHLLGPSAPQHWEEKVRLAEEATRWSREGVSSHTVGAVLWHCGGVQLAEGQRARAEDVWRQMEQVASRTHVVTTRLYVAMRDVCLAVADGHLEEAVELVRRYMVLADESGASARGRQQGVFMLIEPSLYLGREEAWLRAFEESAWLEAHMRLSRVYAAARGTCLAHLGRQDEALKAVRPLLEEAISSSEDETPITPLVLLLGAAIALSHGAAARALAARLAPVAHLSSLGTNTGAANTCIARHLGDAAVLRGDRSAARAYYAQALGAARNNRFRPEVALAHLSLSEVLLQDADDDGRAEGLEHLDIAIPELQDMHMQPGLERALALRDGYQSVPVYARESPAASNKLTAREGEIAALMAGGLSNREIAERLVISEGTVEVHVKRVLSKLGFRSRAQVATWATDQRSERPTAERS